MSNECTDRDLLAVEPDVFTGGGFDSQQLTGGTNGVMSGTAFSSAAAGFQTAGVQAGMVLCIYSTVPAEARAYEIVSVTSATQLVVSVLRSARDAAAIAPPAGTNLKYYVRTFLPQIAAAQATLYEKLRQIGEARGVSPGDFVDSSQLRQAVALASLAAIFTARASHAATEDANWVKAEFYRSRHVAAVAAIHIARDADGDGFAEQTRTLGNVSLRRV